MRTRISKIVSAGILLFLVACGSPYAFPTKAPTGKALDAYKAWKHELAPDPEHHFSIIVPSDWKILQTTVETEPKDDKPLELALFREPGKWIDDPYASIDGEIVVEVFALSGGVMHGMNPDAAPTQWLKSRMKSGNQSFDVIEERTYASANGPAADILVTSGTGTEKIVSRMLAVRSKKNPSKIFVVVCSATEEGYSRVAEAFVEAVTSFRLQVAQKTGSGFSQSAAAPSSVDTAPSSARKIQLQL